MSKERPFTVYVTKYWETRGILAVEVRKCASDGMVSEAKNSYAYYHGKEWWMTEGEAVAHVRRKAAERVRRLRAKADAMAARWLAEAQ